MMCLDVLWSGLQCNLYAWSNIDWAYVYSHVHAHTLAQNVMHIHLIPQHSAQQVADSVKDTTT